MGKTSVIAGVIVAAGVAWTGSSWYFGTQIEKHLDEYLANSNQYLEKEAGGSVRFEKISFQRGIFSSEAILKLRVNVPYLPEKSIELTGKTQIQHGPVPLQSILKGEFFAGYATADTTLVKDEHSKLIFDFTGGKNPYTQHDRIDFSGNIHSNATVAALTIATDKFNFQSQPVKIRSVTDKDLTTGELWADISEISAISARDSDNKIFIKNTSAHLNTKKSASGSYVGDALATIELLKADQNRSSADKSNPLIFDHFKMSFKSEEIDGYMNVGVGYEIGKLQTHGINFGALKFYLALDHLDRKALEKFKTQNRSLFMSAQESSEQAERIVEQYGQLMTNLVRGNMQLHVSPFEWKTANGQIQVQASVNLDGSGIPEQAILNDKVLRQSIKSVEFNLDADTPAVEDIVSASVQVKGKEKNAARQQGKTAVKELLDLIAQTDIARVEGEKIKTRIGFDANQPEDQQISLNSEKMSIQRLAEKKAPIF